jgi:hypothetical protein
MKKVIRIINKLFLIFRICRAKKQPPKEIIPSKGMYPSPSVSIEDILDEVTDNVW